MGEVFFLSGYHRLTQFLWNDFDELRTDPRTTPTVSATGPRPPFLVWRLCFSEIILHKTSLLQSLYNLQSLFHGAMSDLTGHPACPPPTSLPPPSCRIYYQTIMSTLWWSGDWLTGGDVSPPPILPVRGGGGVGGFSDSLSVSIIMDLVGRSHFKLQIVRVMLNGESEICAQRGCVQIGTSLVRWLSWGCLTPEVDLLPPHLPHKVYTGNIWRSSDQV